MKQYFALLILSVLCIRAMAQPYPFNDTRLDDETRIDNLISLMTIDEKISCLSTRPSVPRLGIKGYRLMEGLHGLAMSGPANWAVRGKGSSVTTTFPQAYDQFPKMPINYLLTPAAS